MLSFVLGSAQTISGTSAGEEDRIDEEDEIAKTGVDDYLETAHGKICNRDLF